MNHNAMRWASRAIALALLLALACAAVAPAESLPYWGYAFVNTPNGSVLNLRVGPSVEQPILVGIPYRSQVAVMDDLYADAWVRCEYQGFSGYAASAYLSYDMPRPLATPRPTATASRAQTGLYSGFHPAYYIATVTPSRKNAAVHMRYGPSTLLPVARDYPEGSVLHVYYQNDLWSQVLDPVGHMMGYMMTEFLTYVEPLVFPEDAAVGLSSEETDAGDWFATPTKTPAVAPTPTPEPQTDSNTNG